LPLALAIPPTQSPSFPREPALSIRRTGSLRPPPTARTPCARWPNRPSQSSPPAVTRLPAAGPLTSARPCGAAFRARALCVTGSRSRSALAGAARAGSR
jgi:hypothetical protein